MFVPVERTKHNVVFVPVCEFNGHSDRLTNRFETFIEEFRNANWIKTLYMIFPPHYNVINIIYGFVKWLDSEFEH